MDGNHRPIGQALLRVTWAKDMRQLGGCGYDWLARHVLTGEPIFIEVKDPKKPPSGRKLTESEDAMLAAFPRNFRVVLTEEDALAAVGVSLARCF